MSSSISATRSRRKHFKAKNKKLSKQHIPYIRLAFADDHGWARDREVYCTHRKCGFLQRVDSRVEGRIAGRRHIKAMKLKKARKKAKKLRKKGG